MIFSPLAVAGLYVTIGRYWYLFKRLTALQAGRYYRFEHIVSYSSFKAHSKQVLYCRKRTSECHFFPLCRASFSWKKYPAFLTTDDYQIFSALEVRTTIFVLD